MEILRAMKNNQFVSSDFATLLISSLELQIICLLLMELNATIYGKIAKFMTFDSSLSILVLGNFGLNLIQACFLWACVFLSKMNQNHTKSLNKSRFIRLLQVKHYITIIQIFNINALAFKEESNAMKGIAALNIIFVFCQLYALRIISISYRFLEKNFLRRRNSSIIPWALILCIVISINYFPIIYSCAFLLTRAIIQLYNNFKDLENEAIRQLQWFYPFISVCISIIMFVDHILDMKLFSNIIFLSFIFFFSIYCCRCLAKTVDLQILRYYLRKSTQFFENEDDQQDSKNSQNNQIDEANANQIILQIRTITNILVGRSEYKSTKHCSQKSHVFHYDNWWSFFNQIIINHKIHCKQSNCICGSFLFGKPSRNEVIQSQVFSEKIYQIIKKTQAQSSEVVAKKLKIIQNYFLVEIEKRPFKGYYQLVKLFSNPLTKSETLEVESLLLETRDRFGMIFLREKVRNSNLQLEPVFQLQTQIKEMRLRMNQMASDYHDFYDIFAKKFVQMSALKGKAQILSKHKTQFNNKFDQSLQKFSKSLELVSFAIVYYKFFDEYTDKLNLIEKKAVTLYESYFSPNNIYRNKGIDVFDPHYGSAKVDLVFRVGKVLSISKNLCHILGFDHREIEGHKVNKLMPYMFSRVHDKFLRNFIQRGSLKMLKQKELILYARNSKKLIVPISAKLKVDFSQFDNLCAMAFIKPTPTKSQFILMNNYGKIQEISEGLYRKLFMKSCNEELGKIKRLCMSKMMLSLNFYLKDANQKDDTIHEGLLLSSESEEVLMDYYKFPELSISMKKGQISSGSGASSSRHSFSNESNTSSTGRHSSLDFSDDMNQYSVDMKQSLKDYLQKLDIEKVICYRVSYRLKDYITSEFKCKVLEIVKIWEENSKTDFISALKIEIIDVAELFGLENHQYSKFMNIEPQIFKSSSGLEETICKKSSNMNQMIESQDEGMKLKQVMLFPGLNQLESDGSSVCSVTQVEKNKQNVSAAFSSKIIININLQHGLSLLIACLAILLIVISVFSIGLKNNYINLQHDNLIITNFRINFLTSLGIQELGNFYETLQIDPPEFLAQKKAQLDQKMKQCLIKSTQWISESKQDYKTSLKLNYADRNYSQTRSILKAIMISYSTFLSDPSRGNYITENYANFVNSFLTLINNEEKLITQKSFQLKTQIHIVLIVYAVILIAIGVICVLLRNISFEKQNKIIDFLPFFKANLAKKKTRFFNLLFQVNKDSQNIDVNMVSQIAQSVQAKDFIKQGTNKKSGQNNLKANNFQSSEKNTKLIRVVKNQKFGLSTKIKCIGILVFLLCAFVIFFSEYYFLQTHTQFEAYLQLKNSAFLVQLIPARIILLYFININRALQNLAPVAQPTGLTHLVHDRIFELQLDLSGHKFYGSNMQKIIRDHFSHDICSLIKCNYDPDESTQIYDQQLFYLAYRIINSFNYMRMINDQLPNFVDPKVQIKKWMGENNMLQILKSTELIVDLMKKNEQSITELFTNQIIFTGRILLAISVTLIPVLIISLLVAKKQFMDSISNRLDCTENVYKHIGWEMLGQNTYAVNYFEEKLKMAKTY